VLQKLRSRLSWLATNNLQNISLHAGSRPLTTVNFPTEAAAIRPTNDWPCVRVSPFEAQGLSG
jgi:hypothetical protein